MSEIFEKLLLMSHLKADLARANFEAMKNNHQPAVSVEQQCNTNILQTRKEKVDLFDCDGDV